MIIAARRGPVVVILRRPTRLKPRHERHRGRRPKLSIVRRDFDPGERRSKRYEQASEPARQAPTLCRAHRWRFGVGPVKGATVSGLKAEKTVGQCLFDGTARAFEPPTWMTRQEVKPRRQRSDRPE